MTRKLIIRVLLCSTFLAGSGAILQSCIFDPGARTLFASEEPAKNVTPASNVTPARKTTPTVKKVAVTTNQPAFSRSENSSSGNSSSGGGMGGGSSSSSSGGGWGSDRRLKTDIRRLGSSAQGIPVYAFRYIWGGPMFVGTMAQDLLAIRPEAVIETASGYYMVDYDKLDIAMISLPGDASSVTAEAAMALATRAARIRSRGFVQAAM
ncbi:tail fiber domain-containing protein [Rhizobium binxianense]|uniref:tail fiber domain-containing protein n=1 Tax=Rhizobium binxianense TaxID=3024242 RepID=UPI00236217D7|nr:tail fiber domain-containing protein [Rhizobium sp. MJ37]MDC9835123.1 tail fiber domain-containing protein [Rhizobium sp. MJ37]